MIILHTIELSVRYGNFSELICRILSLQCIANQYEQANTLFIPYKQLSTQSYRRRRKVCKLLHNKKDWKPHHD